MFNTDLSPPELAAQVMSCLRRAQQQLAPRVQEAMQATAGSEEALVEGVVSRYRQRFGEESSQHHRRPAPPEDDEYFADRGYLR